MTESQQPCAQCGGTGSRDELGYCDCPIGEALVAEQEREWSWMIPHVRAASWYRSQGDDEAADAIKRTVCS